VLDISLRIANLDDTQIILDLRNQPSNFRFSGGQVDSKEHGSWFYNRLKSINSEPFWIVCVNSKSVGYVRFDNVNESNMILRTSIAIDKSYQGMGVGKKALEIGVLKINLLNSKITLQAKIHNQNKSSVSIFKSVGYQYMGQIDEFFSMYEKNF
jgi:L-amino acid N-acyltransferase YncA